jgi:hypothetical protein
MAHGVYFVCRGCGREICAWDEGNPYYLDEFGRKRYAYHPDQERDRCTGNDAPHLCLDCGAGFPVDSAAPQASCPSCHSAKLAPTFELQGKPCPFCKEGLFARDLNRYDIS